MTQKNRTRARPFTSFRKDDDGRNAKVVVHPSVAIRRLPHGGVDLGGFIGALIAADLANDPPEGGLRTLEEIEEEDRLLRERAAREQEPK